jgi:hypothetical protein
VSFCLELLSNRLCLNSTQAENILWQHIRKRKKQVIKNPLRERPPGPITMYEGLEQFKILFKGWQMAQKDVCTR